jgi:hypothetical protein
MTTEQKCMICLSDLPPESEFIPPLNCSCTMIVHEECWNQWSGSCLYCRHDIVLEDLARRPFFRCLITCDEYTHGLLSWLILIIVCKIIAY